MGFISKVRGLETGFELGLKVYKNLSENIDRTINIENLVKILIKIT